VVQTLKSTLLTWTADSALLTPALKLLVVATEACGPGPLLAPLKDGPWSVHQYLRGCLSALGKAMGAACDRLELKYQVRA
jgi:hypothetical protein